MCAVCALRSPEENRSRRPETLIKAHLSTAPNPPFSLQSHRKPGLPRTHLINVPLTVFFGSTGAGSATEPPCLMRGRLAVPGI